MTKAPSAASNVFTRFFDSEKASGIVLIVCTAASLMITNSPVGSSYVGFWQTSVAGLTLEHWINDGLMAVFFLLIGLELERELYVGELSNLRDALLPIFAAVGGMIAPAAIHLSLNANTPAQAGAGIPMATDIAFALGALAVLAKRIPLSLKVFVVAYAVIDDLGAVIVIATVYVANLSIGYFAGALAVWTVLVVLNRLRIMSLVPYLLGGALMWFLMLKSGVHATIAGVALAFAIPFSPRDADSSSPSHRLEHFLDRPVAFIVVPVFALANTCVPIGADWARNLMDANSVGIIAGLLIGKPLGVTLLCFVAVRLGLSRLPPDLQWRDIVGAGILGGIGFTMSIFITNLAFAGDGGAINASKIAILLASMAAGLSGFAWLRSVRAPPAPGHEQ